MSPRAAGIDLLRESATVVERSPARYERARWLCRLGAALRRAGHRREARVHLTHAYQKLDISSREGLPALLRGEAAT